MIKSLNFWFLVSFHYILLEHYLLKKNSSWLINESINILEIKTSMAFNLDFPNNTILSRIFFIFLNYWLILLISAIIAQPFNPNAEFLIPIWIRSKEAKAEIEIHSVIAEGKIRKCSIYFRIVQTFLCFILINSFALFLKGNDFLFRLYFSVYIFQFLTCVFFSHILKVNIYFQLNQEFLMFQLILLL